MIVCHVIVFVCVFRIAERENYYAVITVVVTWALLSISFYVCVYESLTELMYSLLAALVCLFVSALLCVGYIWFMYDSTHEIPALDGNLGTCSLCVCTCVRS